MFRASPFAVVFTLLGALLVLFLTAPVVAMVCHESPATLWETFADKDVRASIWVSTGGAAVATAIALVFGAPLGYVLARRDFPGKAVVQGLIDMPVVIPHTAAGIALLTVLGPRAWAGAAAEKLGFRFVDNIAGTVAAMLFVSAPFVVTAARSAFEAVNPRLEKAARSLGASPARAFFSVSLPLAGRPILSGAVMAWARAVSEFGAVLVIAYYPRIGPTLMYERFTSFGLKSARPVAALLALISLGLFITLRLIAKGRSGRA